jgi:hypothetical protein
MGNSEDRSMTMSAAVRRGWRRSTAARVALALHPLDDGATSSRAYDKAVRKDAKAVARSLRGKWEWSSIQEQADRLALEALETYRALASEHGAAYYTTRYDATIAGADHATLMTESARTKVSNDPIVDISITERGRVLALDKSGCIVEVDKASGNRAVVGKLKLSGDIGFARVVPLGNDAWVAGSSSAYLLSSWDGRLTHHPNKFVPMGADGLERLIAWSSRAFHRIDLGHGLKVVATLGVEDAAEGRHAGWASIAPSRRQVFLKWNANAFSGASSILAVHKWPSLEYVTHASDFPDSAIAVAGDRLLFAGYHHRSNTYEERCLDDITRVAAKGDDMSSVTTGLAQAGQDRFVALSSRLELRSTGTGAVLAVSPLFSRPSEGHTSPRISRCVAVTEDGSEALTGHNDGAIYCWRLPS